MPLLCIVTLVASLQSLLKSIILVIDPNDSYCIVIYLDNNIDEVKI